MKLKIHVIHVVVQGSSDQGNIDKFQTLIEQFAASHNTHDPVYTAVTAIPGSAAAWFTAIIQYYEDDNAAVA